MKESPPPHNHITRDIKPYGECFGCDITHHAERLIADADEAMERIRQSTRLCVRCGERTGDDEQDTCCHCNLIAMLDDL